ncbi:MAG: hydantoinase/oxoprolinase family protein, partial [Candidatus Bathyarchaeia archaeon]
ADVLKVVTIQKGYDPREFFMIAFGGAGPTHAAVLAKELGIPKVIVPKTASAFSALGMVETDLRHDFMRTFKGVLSDELNIDTLNKSFEELQSKGIDVLSKEGISKENVLFIRSADMRYLGQHHEVNVEIPSHSLKLEDIPRIADSFHKKHESLYAYSDPRLSIEILNVRVSVIGLMPRVSIPKEALKDSDPSKALKTEREVIFEEKEGYVKALVYDGDRLKPGNLINGPSVIEESTTTIVVPPGYRAKIDQYLNVVMELGG